ncbi:hypothetical protein FRC05_009499 [Tulasnella sp. 425]|nr:hypothetical protein FRC05_009499 [Tulasnella sp. 425]
MLLQILLYLPVESLCALESVSRHFRALITENVNKIYKPIAITHQFASQSAVQHGLKAALRDTLKALGPSKLLQDVDDWKQFCKKCFLLEKSWTPARGDGQPQYRRMGNLLFSGQRVDGEMFFDETERTVALRTSRSRVEVLSMDTGEQLWKLNVVRQFFAAGVCSMLNGSPPEPTTPGSP